MGLPLLHHLTTWRLHTTVRGFVRDSTIRNVFVEQFTLYENEREPTSYHSLSVVLPFYNESQVYFLWKINGQDGS